MKFIYALLATCTFLAVGRAQLNVTTAAALTPSCAIACLGQFLPYSPCDLSSFQCLCTNAPLQANLSTCAQSSCSAADLEKLGSLNSQLCAPYETSNRNRELELVVWIPSVIAIVAVALRCYCRYSTKSSLWWDDWFMVGTTICSVTILVLSCLNMSRAIGRHSWYLTASEIVGFIQLLLVEEFLYIITLAFIRLSILCFYLRVFQHQDVLKKYIVGMIALVVVIAIALCIGAGLQCRPLNALWDLSKAGRESCIDLNAFSYAGGAIGVAQDLTILLLPVPDLAKLQMSLRKKISVLIMFSFGLCACIISIVRLKYLIAFGYSTDFTWDSVDGAIWSSLEVCVAVICACLPAIRVLLAKWLPSVHFFGSSNPPGAASSDAKKSTGIKLTKFSLSKPTVNGDGQDVKDPVDVADARDLEEGKSSSDDISAAPNLDEGSWVNEDKTIHQDSHDDEACSLAPPKLTQSSLYDQRQPFDRTQSEESILAVHRVTSTKSSTKSS